MDTLEVVKKWNVEHKLGLTDEQMESVAKLLEVYGEWSVAVASHFDCVEVRP